MSMKRSLAAVALLLLNGCGPVDVGPIDLVVDPSSTDGTVRFSWTTPSEHGDYISELRIVSCDELGCPPTSDTALSSGTTVWSVRDSDQTEVSIPCLESPIVFPDAASDFTPRCYGSVEPQYPPSLDAGAKFLAVAVVNENTLVVEKKGSGLAEFVAP